MANHILFESLHIFELKVPTIFAQGNLEAIQRLVHPCGINLLIFSELMLDCGAWASLGRDLGHHVTLSVIHRKMVSYSTLRQLVSRILEGVIDQFIAKGIRPS